MGFVYFLEEMGDYFVHARNCLVFVMYIKNVSLEAATVLAYMLKLTLQGIAQEL